MTRAPIAIIGKACRLPGADSVDAFWQLLIDRRCSVKTIDDSRWATDRFLHPRRAEPGKSYTFAAGVLDDVWGFDPTVFSISPREAEQMDPQQRLALQLVWEAFEDAGIPPSRMAKTETGVFVGASALDYGNRGIFDAACIDAYFATGNALSIVSNRISYAFDLRGPSFTVDTACSSSIVALHEAALAIETGRIDTAVVVGVNILASPISFVSFAQASMLSPRGLCRAFDAGADGYVRAEGAVAIVLRAERAARAAGNTVQARIVGSGVNSDGRTVGMSFPSSDAQVALLRRVYDEASVAPSALAFIEAHGTGTRVGDPAEASAVGQALAKRRGAPLPIGSVKTNVGHLEPASGLVGLLKAMLALEHNLLPASLHVETLNPDIPFDDLNLRVATSPMPLTNGKAIRAAGINSFGFGGTNAHVIVADPEFAVPARPEVVGLAPNARPLLALSARSPEALLAMAGAYGELLADKNEAAAVRVAASVAESRDLLTHRLVVPSSDPRSWAPQLAAASAGTAEEVVIDTAVGKEVPLAFVYSGNGSQWAGMGRALHAADAIFRDTFAEVDALFSDAAGWTLSAALFADDLADRLRRAEVAQPLLFATQVATTAALRARGVEPSVVLGHSVGEVAAAWAAGALDLEQAVHVIHSRSHHQEIAWNAGTMAAVLLPFEDTQRLIVEGGFNEVEIAAVNSARSLTVSGPYDQIRAMAKLARTRRVAMRVLELEYPFHTALIDGVRAPLASDLAGLSARDGDVPFISTVTGDHLAGTDLGSTYWWRNVRQRVRFADAVASAIRRGARVFVEVGPRAVLQNYINDGLEAADVTGGVLSCNDQSTVADPIRRTIAQVVAKGGAVDRGRVFGQLRGQPERLPTYRWQNRRFAIAPSVEMQDIFGLHRSGAHPLIGARTRSDAAEWTTHLDPGLVSYLTDHQVGGRVIVPAAALAEMAVAAGRAWLDSPSVELQDFEILRPLVLETDTLVEVTTRISPESRTVEILSRPRLRDETRTIHAFGRVSTLPTRRPPSPSAHGDAIASLEPSVLYARARSHGLEFGPSFQGAERIETLADGRIRVGLKTQDEARLHSEGYGLYPPTLDSCFHGLIQLFASIDGGVDARAYLPIRFGSVRLFKPAAPVRTALLTVNRASERSIQAEFTLLDEQGDVVATLADCRFRATVLNRRASFDRLAYHYSYEQLAPPVGAADDRPRPQPLQAAPPEHAPSVRHDDDLLLQAFAVSLAQELVFGVCGRRRQFTVEALIAGGSLSAASSTLFNRLLGILRDHGSASVDGDRWQLPRKTPRHSAQEILRTVVTEYPARVAEAVLGARAAALWPRILREGPAAEPPYSSATLVHFGGASPSAGSLVDGISSFVARVIDAWPSDRPLRILELAAGSGALTRRLAEHTIDPRVTIVATDPDAGGAERLRFAFAGRPGVRTEQLDLDAADGAANFGAFDLVVSAAPLNRAIGDLPAVQRLARLVADGGRLAIAALAPGVFVDMVFGIGPDAVRRSTVIDAPVGLLRTAEEWAADLQHARFSDVDVTSLPDAASPALLVTASARRRSARVEASDKPQGHVVLLGAETGRGRFFADELTRRFEAEGRVVHLVDDDERYGNGGGTHAPAWGDVPSLVVDLTKPFDDEHAATDVIEFASRDLEGRAAAGITAQVGKTLGLARGLSHTAARLWVVAPGALQGIVDGGPDRPPQAAHAGFLRVLTNEVPDLDLRVVDVDQDLDARQCAAELVRAVLHPGADREIAITPGGVRAPRLRRGLPHDSQAAKGECQVGFRLATGREGGIEGLDWIQAPLKEPGSGEVVIDIAATGLNFRDVMWALGLLPDEALEDGFAGPTLGIEGAGTVLSIGPGVRRVKPGDRVITFASAAFTSRAVVPEMAVAVLPASIGFESGATIPVAFLTAYYALHHLARLERGEWLLVHGGAGGVGLAALQIARWRGARTIATAGSDEKRDFLRMLGADHVLSSRSLDFADEARALTSGQGVDVVLNSLAGEAMERSLQTLRPFGRFLELGKRDFYANARLGLRPFRRNVSYFGIDADQLLAHRPALTARLFRDIVRLFERGTLSPLPYRVFQSDEVRDAFRGMQQSSHVGKIVVTPPKVAGVAAATATFPIAPDGTHLIVGGLGGFGLAAARWLVERGARHLALLTRSGAKTDAAKTAVAQLEQLGAGVTIFACDVADAPALEATLGEIRRRLPPLKGVIHAAMVLDDGLIANLDEERFLSVLKPKVDGASNLDRLARDASLDYFVLFSSATTVIGNPGQANYVAANTYLESLARARRAEGLPGLAVAWGAIEDVGYLARKADVRGKLSRRIGQAGLTSREALDALGRVLSETRGGRRETAAVVIAPMDWALARRELKLLASPAYAPVVSDAELSAADTVTRVDLVGLVRGRDPQSARDAVAEILAGEVSRILKLPAKDIAPQRSLAELGMDSLMGLELRLGVERRFGIELPLPSISDVTTLATMAAAIVARIQDAEASGDGDGHEHAELVRRHVAEDVTTDELAEIGEAVRSRRAEVERTV
jgi:acyl transferase domain-containing protein/NADPH:quinone reductase-like Zn-dependent oxidoreductase/acyl carrier protein/SAM-dependent methyltransferase